MHPQPARRRFFLVFVALAALALLAGCGGDSGGSNVTPGADTSGDAPALPDGQLPPPGAAQVETALSKATVIGGEPVTVTCDVTPKEWASAATEVRLAAGAAASAAIVDHEVTFSAVGTYDLQCAIAGTEIVDPTPERVTVVGAGAQNVDTAVAPNPVVAGGSVAVTCSSTDAYGEAVPDATYDIDVIPPDGVTVDGATLRPTRAGTVEVACAARGGPTDASPVRLTVEAGPLARVAAQLAEPEIVAGGSTTVTCRATDAFGNGVGGYSFSIESDEGVEIAGVTLSSTAAGLHKVDCRWVDGDDAAIEHGSAQLTVRAGAPADLILKAVPERATYNVGNQVTIEREVIDVYGNPVPNADVTEVAVTPETGIVRLSDEAFRFAGEGQFTFMAAILSNPEIEDRLTLFCDGGGPAVVIDFPLRGSTLSGSSTVTVTGVVTDEVSGVASLRINDAEVAIGADGSFQQTVTAVHGMNIIESVATDGAGQEEKSWRSFYYSDEWTPMNPANPESATVADALRVFIGEETLDSDDPAALDVTDIFSSVLADLDLMSLIPRPATVQSVTWCTYSVYLESLSYDTPIVSLSTFGPTGAGSSGGIHIRAVLPGLAGNVSAPAPEFLCPDVTADIYADSVVLEANLYLEVSEDGQVTSSVEVEDVAIEGLNVDVQGVLGFLSNWLINFFEGDIATLVEDQFVATIEEQVGSLVSGLMAFLDLQQQLEIGPLAGTGPPVVLNLSARAAAIHFTDAGGFAALDGAVLADKLVSRNPLGSIARGSCTGGVVGAYELPGAEPLELAAYDDFLNEAAFAFWYGGGLELHLNPEDFAALGLNTAQYGLGALTLTTHLLLPPIVEGCANDGKLLLQLGDGYVEASFDFIGTPTELALYLQLAIDATLIVQPGAEGGMEVGIQLGELEAFEVEVVDINEAQADKQKTFEDLLRSLVPTLLQSFAADPIAFAIPSFDLGGLSEALPEGLWMTVAPSQLGRTLGNTTAAGRLAPGTPPPPETPAP